MITVLRKIYWNQVHNSRKYGRPDPDYSLNEFIAIFSGDNIFLNLYVKWRMTGNKWDKPSFDRLDNSKPYSFSNIRVVTWMDNFQKDNGVLRSVRLEKGNEVKVFDNYNQAAKHLGVRRESLREACIKGYNCKGHRVTYEN